MAALDDLLDFVLLAMAERTNRHLFHRITAKLFDLGRFVLVRIAVIAAPLRGRPVRLDGFPPLGRQGRFDNGMF